MRFAFRLDDRLVEVEQRFGRERDFLGHWHRLPVLAAGSATTCGAGIGSAAGGGV